MNFRGKISGDGAVLERVAFLGCYEPRHCGIATFTHDLCEAVSQVAPEVQCFAGAMNDRPDGYHYPPRVWFEIFEKNLDSYGRAADFLNFKNTEVLCVQHEFGIFGGPAGSHILRLLRQVRMPVVTTLHTVLSEPNPAQRKVMDELVRRSERLVVMARKGAKILCETYGVERAKIDIIPHGIPDSPWAGSDFERQRSVGRGARVLLTFGLLGPGKGIEYAIKALPEIVRRHPDVVYLVLGETHPHLLDREGERYRMGLEQLTEDLGVQAHVIFENRFVSAEELTDFINAADIYLTPYLNEAQITSGTLAHVFGAGNAVVSTPYCHARELLDGGRGILVPFRDPHAIAEGVCAYLDDPVRLERTRREAYELGRETVWPAVAHRYLESFRQACEDCNPPPRVAVESASPTVQSYDLPAQRLDHIVRMSDGTGIFQHATFNVPNFQEGYCTDDNARAFILCNMLDGSGELDPFASRYLAFLAAALNQATGRFRNFMNHGRQWLEDAGSEDSHGRALWALGVGAGRSRNEGHRRLCVQLFERGLVAVDAFSSPRAWAFSLLGIHEFLQTQADHSLADTACGVLTGRLVKLWENTATDEWPWFEASATYDNARLCQALILSGARLSDKGLVEIGLKSLRWLTLMQKTPGGHFRPIGSNGFHHRGGVCAEFDQQPVESHAMVAACLEAFRVTADLYWSGEARRAFEWFLGGNDLGLPIYDSATGGCGDGLHSDRVNANQGAESSLAFHLSLAEMQRAGQVDMPT